MLAREARRASLPKDDAEELSSLRSELSDTVARIARFQLQSKGTTLSI